MGAVRPGNLVLPQLAVVGFGSGAAGRTIAQCLTLADVATAPSDSAAAARLGAADLGQAGVDYDGWAGASVSYVLKGTGPSGTEQVELYDIASKTRILARAYSTGSAEPRRVALRIADDVMQAMTGRPGIFSSRIAYLVGGRNKDLMIIEPDGQGQRRLTDERALMATPTWGKLGTEIYFTSYRDNNPDLYGLTLDGRRWDISRRPGQNTSPSWSEAANRIALSLSKDGNSEIYTMTREGRGLSRLTNSPSEETAPAWSPDGRQLAFTSDRDGIPGIFIMGASGGAARRVSPAGRYADGASWSPDGQRLAFTVREQGAFNVYVLELSSGNLTAVARGGMNTSPTWGPSSRHLVFSSTRSGPQQLYMVNIDTRQARPIPNTSGAQEPSWGPLMK
jgi:TolB protein